MPSICRQECFRKKENYYQKSKITQRKSKNKNIKKITKKIRKTKTKADSYQKDPSTRIDSIVERSFISPLDREVALLAVDLKQKYKLHIIDAIIIRHITHLGLVLVTGDQHFKDLPNVEII
ncbi:MAG: PIN domain-containing protein [Candidatus Jordarchaeaceae archaeon]